MLIVMRKSATDEQIDRVLEVARAQGLTPVPIPGAQRTAVGLTGKKPFVHLDRAPHVGRIDRRNGLNFWFYRFLVHSHCLGDQLFGVQHE